MNIGIWRGGFEREKMDSDVNLEMVLNRTNGGWLYCQPFRSATHTGMNQPNFKKQTHRSWTNHCLWFLDPWSVACSSGIGTWISQNTQFCQCFANSLFHYCFELQRKSIFCWYGIWISHIPIFISHTLHTHFMGYEDSNRSNLKKNPTKKIQPRRRNVCWVACPSRMDSWVQMKLGRTDICGERNLEFQGHGLWTDRNTLW